MSADRRPWVDSDLYSPLRRGGPVMGEAPLARLLIVDDDATAIQALGAILAGVGQLQFAMSGADGLRLAAENAPDLVLLDAEGPALNGLAVCRALKADRLLAEVPVIFVTGHTDQDTELQALAAGANDFITKPLRPAVVLARVRTQLRLKLLTDTLRRQATRDGLTGVANRAWFDEALASEWARAVRSGEPLAVALADVDHFKRYNDHYGHPAGDDCLRAVAQAMRAALQRPADVVARYGGEEFSALLPATTAAGALHLAEGLRLAVARLALPHADSPSGAQVTISVGVATTLPVRAQDDRSAGAGAAGLLAAADRALYQAKHAGRNRVVAATLPTTGVASATDAMGGTGANAPPGR